MHECDVPRARARAPMVTPDARAHGSTEYATAPAAWTWTGAQARDRSKRERRAESSCDCHGRGTRRETTGRTLGERGGCGLDRTARTPAHGGLACVDAGTQPVRHRGYLVFQFLLTLTRDLQCSGHLEDTVSGAPGRVLRLRHARHINQNSAMLWFQFRSLYQAISTLIFFERIPNMSLQINWFSYMPFQISLFLLCHWFKFVSSLLYHCRRSTAPLLCHCRRFTAS
jgi:hypothetical protein